MRKTEPTLYRTYKKSGILSRSIPTVPCGYRFYHARRDRLASRMQEIGWPLENYTFLYSGFFIFI